MTLPVLDFLKSGFLFSPAHSMGSAVSVGWGTIERKSRWQEFSDLDSRPILYAPDFFLEDPLPWWRFSSSIQISRAEFQEILNQIKKETPESETFKSWSEPSFALFQEQFEDLMQRFAKGELKKAVPVAFQKSLTSFNVNHKAKSIYHLFSKAGASAHLYGMWNEEEGILGATPEVLFQINSNQKLITMALAGTKRKILGEKGSSLLEDPKERYEHQIVIDGILTALASFGTPRVGKTEVLELPSLFHLLTPIEVALSKEVEILECIERLHPTPALGAFPKEKGMQWLKEVEFKQPRFRFGAPIGWITFDPFGSIQEATFLVAIRNIQWNCKQEQSEFLLGAGCGIVPASQLDREWAEILAKMNSVKQFFGIEVTG